MPLFTRRPIARCPHCGALVRREEDPTSYLCPKCKNPGPWASPEQARAWEAGERRLKKERDKREKLLRVEQETARKRQLQLAASLTLIEVPGFIAKKGEAAYFWMSADLAEWKKTPGHYEGGGSMRGITKPRENVAGYEDWVITDSGTAVITSNRVVFLGGSRALEWAYSKIIGLFVDRSKGYLTLQVTNRQRGNILKLEDLELFEAALEAAIKAHQEA